MGAPPVEANGRGPAGTATNQQTIDKLTNSRSRNTPPGKLCDPSQGFDPYVGTVGWGLLVGIHTWQDKFGFEIFATWFLGESDDVTFDSEEWGAYMRAEPRLAKQIESQLTTLAYGLRRLAESTDTIEIRQETLACGLTKVIERKPGSLKGTFLRRFHAEVGDDSGGYHKGYDVLHGSNKDVGDFTIEGRFALENGPTGSATTVTFEDMVNTFNDIADANKRYKSDISFARASVSLNPCMGMKKPPKDYVLHIVFKAAGPFKVELEKSGQAPSWLKTFKPN